MRTNLISLVYLFHFPTPPWFCFCFVYGDGDGDGYWARAQVYLMKTGNYGQFDGVLFVSKLIIVFNVAITNVISLL